ncbi:DUF4912 domain-containing protein [Neobacillus mesonae]|uniref:DUF4912 domain-containing protein n=1 Tax=Neobacillus mesonae TaxID=1193713 RepID=UPI00203CF0ED|nr:DUF4912 domain-containing protein [Neobacillus mesonae]MCM3566610.1 DUF4912 domain-containing protein [Neobacillus mesonae]
MMINEILRLRKEGLSFRRIAEELNTTVGKVQYRYNKWRKNPEERKALRIGSLKSEIGKPSEDKKEQTLIPLKRELNVRMVTAKKIALFWDVSEIADKVLISYFNIHLTELVSVIRVYDVTDIIFDGKNAHQFYEITVPYQNGHWFVKGLAANRSYVAELGVLIPATGYFPLYRSNCVKTPKCELSSNLLSHDQLEMLRYEADPPKWTDHVSTYSYYGEEDDMEEK